MPTFEVEVCQELKQKGKVRLDAESAAEAESVVAESLVFDDSVVEWEEGCSSNDISIVKGSAKNVLIDNT